MMYRADAMKDCLACRGGDICGVDRKVMNQN